MAAEVRWVQVLLSETNKVIANADCVNHVFLTHLKKAAGYAHLKEDVDLMNPDNSVLNLNQQPEARAKDLLEPGREYYLCKIEIDEPVRLWREEGEEELSTEAAQ